MAQPRYDIYFTGQLVDGSSKEQSIKAFAALFKMPTEKAARLFTGTAQLIKRGAEKDEAIRYKAALHKAGMMCAFKPHQANPAAVQTPPSQRATEVKNHTPNTSPEHSQIQTTPAQSGNGLTLAPSGSDLLHADERPNHKPVDVDTSGISLASVFSEPTTNIEPVTPAPNTSHFSIAETGADLLEGHHQEFIAAELDLSEMSLAPVGADLEQLKPERPAITPDTSRLSLAATGADLRDDQHKKPSIKAPDVSHISLQHNE